MSSNSPPVPTVARYQDTLLSVRNLPSSLPCRRGDTSQLHSLCFLTSLKLDGLALLSCVVQGKSYPGQVRVRGMLSPRCWFSNVVVYWNHLGDFNKCLCLDPTS